MARIPDAELARLKAEVSVSGWWSAAGSYCGGRGQDFVGACPFHDDDSPSLVVTPGKNLWHCLGACGRGGGPIDWVMTAQGVSRSTTAKLPALAAPDAEDQVLLNKVVGYYAEALVTHEAAQTFLTRRKLDHPEAIERFKIGFADRTLGYRLPPSQVQAGRALRTRLRDLGVLKANGHEHFRSYLTFPVLDVEGNVGEVYGRLLGKPDQRTQPPKHLYLPGPHRGGRSSRRDSDQEGHLFPGAGPPCQHPLDGAVSTVVNFLTLWTTSSTPRGDSR